MLIASVRRIFVEIEGQALEDKFLNFFRFAAPSISPNLFFRINWMF